MRTYKDPDLNKLYQALLGKTPQWLSDHKIWGSTLHSFKHGYEGRPKPYYIVRGTGAYVCYMAGRDSRQLENKRR